MENKYDTVVIGGGPAGLAAAHALAAHQQVLVVEGNLWGGTCPNFGCDPKKMLYGVAESVRQTRAFADAGVTGNAAIDWPQMMHFKRQYTDGVPAGTVAGLDAAGITHVDGHASFVDEHTLSINGALVSADRIIIATGAHANIPDIPGRELLETSTDFLALPDQPTSIGFIGAGYVAVELANIAAIAGVTVHIFQHNHRLLRGFPEADAQLVADALAAKGVIWHWDTNVQQVTPIATGGLQVQTDAGTFALDHLYAAAGRPANVDGLNLEAVGISLVRGGIAVDDHLRTAAPNVYAIGDVAASPVPKLTPVAGLEGRYVASQILGATAPISYPAIPHAVFAGPELATVGISSVAALAEPDKYSVQTFQVGAWYTYNRLRDQNARVTVVTSKDEGIVKGACVYSTGAEELVNYFSNMIGAGETAAALTKWMPVYPSAASDLEYFL